MATILKQKILSAFETLWNYMSQIVVKYTDVVDNCNSSNVDLPLSANQGRLLRNMIYPVGSIYLSVNSVNPSTLFGGVWVQLKDRFLLGAGDAYTNGTTGGSADAVLVSHGHIVTSPTGHTLGVKYGSGGSNNQVSATFGFAPDTVNTGGLYGGADANYNRFFANSVGESGTGKNMPPYLVVYMWKRTA